MHAFRQAVRKHRVVFLAFLLVELFTMVDGRNFVQAYQVHEEKEQRLEEVSKTLGIPVEQLRLEHEGLFDQLAEFFRGEAEDPVKAAGRERLQQLLAQHAEQVANNPYLPQIEAVEREHRIHRVEGTLHDILQLTARGEKQLAEGSQRALLRGLHHGLDDSLRLPEPKEGLPAKALERHAALQAQLDRLAASIRPIVADTQDKAMQGLRSRGTLAQKVEQMRLFQAVEVARPVRAPRFADRPLPTQILSQRTRSQSADEARQHQSPLQIPTPEPRSADKNAAKSVDARITALAAELENSPARMLAWVRDEVAFDPKWGATKSPAGTLDERLGTSWDQAWLLQQLLTTAGVDARFEWGQIEITPEQLTNWVGVEDPWRAADLLTTAGNPVVLLTAGSQVVAARIDHAWVRAHVDYVPNRGVRPGPGDTWVAMDPTLVSMRWSEGLRVHESVPFSLESYLLSGTELSPRRFYEDALWAHIRANDIQCTTLAQLTPSGTVESEPLPFVPGTLKAEVTRLDGQSTTVPTSLQYQLALTVRTADGAELLSWSSPWPATYGQRFELAWPGATADDQATLDAHGGVFETPPYLVDLAPQVRLDGATVATGSAVGAALDVEVEVTVTAPGAAQSASTHQLQAGEHGALALDLGTISESRAAEARSVLVSADPDSRSGLELQALALTYLRDLAQDLREMAGWRWRRLVRLGTSMMAIQTADVTTTVAGTPLAWQSAERFVDVARNDLGLFPASGAESSPRSTAELLGAQGSFLEGTVFPAVLGRQGIGAVDALTRVVREGGNLEGVDSTNLSEVLGRVDLGEEIESAVTDAVSQGKVAWIPNTATTVNLWSGVGYVLADPDTGSAAYLLSGGYAGGADVGPAEVLQELLGSEPWWTNGPLKPLFDFLLSIVDAVALPEEPQSIQGDPVNLATGNFLTTVTDVLIPAPAMPIRFARTYNSRGERGGLLGLGWSHTFGDSLEEVAGGILLYESDGSEHYFPESGDGFGRVAGKPMTLLESAAGYELRVDTGAVTYFSAAGRLEAREDSLGNRVTVEYGPSGSPRVIRDTNGRQVLELGVTGGLLNRITDHTGRTVEFIHDALGRLVQVRDLDGAVWSYGYDLEDNLVEIVDPAGTRDTYVYDRADRLIQHVDRSGESEYFAYGPGGRSATVTDRRGFRRYFEMDDLGRALLAVDPLGNRQEAAWDSDNNRTEYVDSRGARFQRFYDSEGNLTQEIDPLGRTKNFTYEASRLSTMTESDGRVVTMEYDARGLPISSTLQAGDVVLTEAYEFNDLGQLTSHTDSNGATTSWDYDAATGARIRETTSTGAERLFEIDELGRGIRAYGAGISEFSMVWEGSSRLKQIGDTTGYVVTGTFDALNRLIRTDSPRGTTIREYDPKGRLTRMTDEQGATHRLEYDAEGNRTLEVDPLGHETTTLYDAIGRVMGVIEPGGAVWSMGHCAAMQATEQGIQRCASGNCQGETLVGGGDEFCSITDPLGQTSRREYNVLGDVTRQIDPLGGEQVLRYDESGRLESLVDSQGRETRFEYDLAGRQTAVIEPDASRTEYVYGKGSLLTAIIDANGNPRTFDYDAAGRVIAESDALGNTTEMSYHPLGMVTQKRLPSGGVIDYRFDDTRLVEKSFGGEIQQFGYDALGRRTSASSSEATLLFDYDAKNRLIREENQTLGEVITHGYDEASNRISTTIGDRQLTYHYGSRSELVEMIDSRSGAYRFEYDELGRRTNLHYPNGTETRYEYDAVGRTRSLVTLRADGEVLDGFAYSYDLGGNVLSRSSLHDGASETFEYDSVDRLVSWSRGTETTSYGYDAVGNRTRLVETDRETVYAYDVANRLLSETTTGTSTVQTLYAWSADGRQIRKESSGSVTTYDYDLLGNLTRVTEAAQSISWGYDPLGRRFREQTGAGTSHFLASGENVAAEIRADGRQIDFTHGPWVDEVLSESVGTPTGGPLPSIYYHHDDLGSVTSWSDASGQRSGFRSYTPFGSEVAAQGAAEGRYGFTGREADPTGLYHYRARSYDPQTGRFNSVDPVGSQFLAPKTLNGFDYALGNPLRYRDPSGKSVISPLKKIFLGLIWGTVLMAASYTCVKSEAIFECLMTIGAAALTAPLTDGALFALLGIYVISVIYLIVKLGIGVRNGDIGFLPAVFIATAITFIGYLWLFVTAITSGILMDLFGAPPIVDGIVALVLAASFAAFSYWFVNVVTLKTEIKL